MNQTCKNEATPFDICNSAAKLRGKKEQDVFVKTYDVRETIFSDQTGKYPVQLQ
jgi:hypothetical protein